MSTNKEDIDLFLNQNLEKQIIPESFVNILFPIMQNINTSKIDEKKSRLNLLGYNEEGHASSVDIRLYSKK